MHGYEPFWKLRDRHDPTSVDPVFAPREDALLSALWDAHQAVAMRGNASGSAFTMAYQGSGDYTKALAGALATMGDLHGPIEENVHFLAKLVRAASSLEGAGYVSVVGYLDRGDVPGWGNALVKGRNDPYFLRVRDWLEAMNQPLVDRIDAITGALHARGKLIYPNPSCWTAAVAITVGMPAELSPYLFIAARLPVWSRAILPTN